MEAAQTNVYDAPASSADITRSIRMHITHSLAKKRGASSTPFKSFRVQSTHKGGEMGGKPVSQEEVTDFVAVR